MDGKTHGFAPDGDEIIYDLGLEPRSRQIAKSATAVSNFYTAFGKRLFDLTFVVLALPIALPLMAVLYVMTRRDGPFLEAR